MPPGRRGRSPWPPTAATPSARAPLVQPSPLLRERVARSATGDPGGCDLRDVVNALFHQNRTGCRWRCLPHDLPAWSAVFHSFPLWRADGLDQQIRELPRRQVRESAERLEVPSRRGP
ncbi:transposase, partial [Streptomyces prasinopilosus]|uniref:transposase n=1 Tax=Streptomyces prasinopilosus TaxID=67344 RepID=UPI0030B88501